MKRQGLIVLTVLLLLLAVTVSAMAYEGASLRSPNVLGAPTHLSVTEVDEDSVSLHWVTNGGEQFLWWRSTYGDEKGIIPVGSLEDYTVGNLQCGVSYDFIVEAVVFGAHFETNPRTTVTLPCPVDGE